MKYVSEAITANGGDAKDISAFYNSIPQSNETEAYELLVEDGKITDAKARSIVDGKEYMIHAKAYVTYGGAAMGYAFTSGRLVGADIAETIK